MVDDALQTVRNARLLIGDPAGSELTATEVLRRNRSVHLRRPDGSGFIVKRSRIRGQPDAANEAMILQTLHVQDPIGAATWTPTLLAYDAQRESVVLAIISGSVDLRTLLGGARPLAGWIGTFMGKALAWLHRLPGLPVAVTGAIQPPGPRILSLHRPSLDEYGGLSAGNIALLRAVQATPALVSLLDELARGWQAVELIHGDVRADNVLVDLRRGRRDLRLVDWEFAGPGDPAWDVGSALSMFVEAWIASIPFTGDSETMDVAAEAARRPMAAMKPVARRLWSAYSAALPEGSALPFLHRTVRFAAARLVQSAFEATTYSFSFPGHAVLLAQVAANIALAPEQAVYKLFGVGDVESRAPGWIRGGAAP